MKFITTFLFLFSFNCLAMLDYEPAQQKDAKEAEEVQEQNNKTCLLKNWAICCICASYKKTNQLRQCFCCTPLVFCFCDTDGQLELGNCCVAIKTYYTENEKKSRLVFCCKCCERDISKPLPEAAVMN